jgi:hypothetical protein
MDVLYFLKERTAFIRQFYERASSPFEERIRLIEAGEEPFVPPYSEDGEPPFLEEWIEADESRDALGHACISMLSASLQLFLQTWSDNLHLQCRDEHKKQFKKNGWFNGFRVCFEEAIGVSWEQSPTDLVLLEEMALARNRVQHPTEIHTVGIQHSRHDYEKLGRRLFFTDQFGKKAAELLNEGEFSWLMGPTVKVSSGQLMEALSAVEAFCEWLDLEIDRKIREGP